MISRFGRRTTKKYRIRFEQYSTWEAHTRTAIRQGRQNFTRDASPSTQLMLPLTSGWPGYFRLEKRRVRWKSSSKKVLRFRFPTSGLRDMITLLEHVQT